MFLFLFFTLKVLHERGFSKLKASRAKKSITKANTNFRRNASTSSTKEFAFRTAAARLNVSQLAYAGATLGF